MWEPLLPLLHQVLGLVLIKECHLHHHLLLLEQGCLLPLLEQWQLVVYLLRLPEQDLLLVACHPLLQEQWPHLCLQKESRKQQ
mmetsp:Transcript_18828/g.17983  ORF Transcript_18828/g.17983 Transcript_18828/m.17983 type:complete len:83 (-) Transcript_18828:261-509(-)